MRTVSEPSLAWDNDGDAHYSIEEWWNHSGDHHEGAPSNDELLYDAAQITIHAWNESGDEIYFTSFSDDGWLPDELAADVDDALEGYGITT